MLPVGFVDIQAPLFHALRQSTEVVGVQIGPGGLNGQLEFFLRVILLPAGVDDPSHVPPDVLNGIQIGGLGWPVHNPDFGTLEEGLGRARRMD